MEGSKELNELLELISEGCKVGIGLYKQTTLQRRIKRRMLVHARAENLKDYLRFIKGHPAELESLCRDILIHVTGFFRDKETFSALAKQIFPNLFQNRKLNDAPIRVWVPGCSTGEEVYSIAMVLLEYMWKKSRTTAPGAMSTKEVQIFAMDISEIALDRARNGVYPESSVADISQERLSRFFCSLDGGYQINKSVREMWVFARQKGPKIRRFRIST